MRNAFKTAVLLAFLGGLFIVIGGAIGGSSGMVFGLALGLLFCGGTYWFSDKLAIASARAKPVSREEDPQLHAMVEDLAQRAGLPMPRRRSSRTPSPPAAAPPRAWCASRRGSASCSRPTS